MTIDRRAPDTKDFLSPINFHFSLTRAPGLVFFVQKASIPGISLNQIDVPTPFVPLPFPGGKLSYSGLVITYKVDEHMQSYLEIHNWMKGLGHPTSFGQYADLVDGEGVFSDATLVVLSNQRRPTFNVTFKNIFPVLLSGIDFDVTQQSLDYVTTTVQFTYESYEIVAVDPSL